VAQLLHWDRQLIARKLDWPPPHAWAPAHDALHVQLFVCMAFGARCASIATSATRWNAELLPSSGHISIRQDFGYLPNGGLGFDILTVTFGVDRKDSR